MEYYRSVNHGTRSWSAFGKRDGHPGGSSILKDAPPARKTGRRKGKTRPHKPEDGAPDVLTRRTNVKDATRKIRVYGPPAKKSVHLDRIPSSPESTEILHQQKFVSGPAN